ncbi:hypothetical protein LCGC14_0585320 [marine sediment metagenome]|uniref:Uncharacterized protein n=1 Tax=marine sediment metagenome TaxID=412755 RepID=A0A0F9RF57_9ZZZZ
MKINERNLRFNRRLMVFTALCGAAIGIISAETVPIHFGNDVWKTLWGLANAFFLHSVLFHALKRDKYGK